MALSARWPSHIAAWQSSGLSQAEYCAQQQINVRTFTARLSDYRKVLKVPKANSVGLIPVHIEPSRVASIVFTHAQGHRVELPVSVPAS